MYVIIQIYQTWILWVIFSIPYPDAPCREYLPTFPFECGHVLPNVGKYFIHGASGFLWNISAVLWVLFQLSPWSMTGCHRFCHPATATFRKPQKGSDIERFLGFVVFLLWFFTFYHGKSPSNSPPFGSEYVWNSLFTSASWPCKSKISGALNFSVDPGGS